MKSSVLVLVSLAAALGGRVRLSALLACLPLSLVFCAQAQEAATSIQSRALQERACRVAHAVGVGVVHFTKSAKDTQKFLDTFDPLWQGALKDKIVEGPLRLSVGEVMEDFIYPGDPNYVEPKKKGAKKA